MMSWICTKRNTTNQGHINGAMLKPNCMNNMRMQETSLEEYDPDDPGSPFTLTGSDRKRRRGVIEKRRRDRINSSLYELKRLIPDMTRKPGTAKLEKAEILQTTVDFLQRLYKEGHVLGAEMRAAELRHSGFQDCLVEVTRVLATYEGIGGTGEEMRCALLAHLHQRDQQRLAETKAYLANIAAVAHAFGSASKDKRYNSDNHINWASMADTHNSSASTMRNDCSAHYESGIGSCRTAHTGTLESGVFYGRETKAVQPEAQSIFSTYPENNASVTHRHNLYPTPGCFSVVPTSHSAYNLPFTTTQGQNESQSTSSPPFQSTPDDTDLITSPASKLTNRSREGYTKSDADEYIIRGVGTKTPKKSDSLLAELESDDLHPEKYNQFGVGVMTSNRLTMAVPVAGMPQMTVPHRQDDHACSTYNLLGQPTKVNDWTTHSPSNPISTDYTHSYWSYPFQTL